LENLKAIDVLIKHMNYSDILATFSLASTPYLRALVEIGESSVSSARRGFGQWLLFHQMQCRQSLGEIGSPDAIAALERASKTERDAVVLSLIKIT